MLDPLRYGVFALSLFFNKVLRRFIPVFMLLLLVSSMVLACSFPWAQAALALQAVFYLTAILYVGLLYRIPEIAFVTKLSSAAFYFCWGNYGTLLGVIAFLRGQRIGKW